MNRGCPWVHPEDVQGLKGLRLLVGASEAERPGGILPNLRVIEKFTPSHKASGCFPPQNFKYIFLSTASKCCACAYACYKLDSSIMHMH